MTLADLRKIAVKQRLRIRFGLSNGMECVLNEHGIAEVPSLRAVPNFNLEDELAGAQKFLVEPVSTGDKNKAQTRTYTRDQMTAFEAPGPAHDAAHTDNEE